MKDSKLNYLPARSNVEAAEIRLAKVTQSSQGILNGIKRVTSDVAVLNREKESMKALTKQQLNEMKLALKSSLGAGLLSQIKSVQKDLKFMTDKYNKEYEERKKLHNTIQELKGNIRVYMRCRPPSRREIDEIGEDAVCVSYPAPGEVRVMNEKNREKTWEFDEVFNFDSTQARGIYRCVRLSDLCDGRV